ncbi:MAG TPA: DUF3141 domain-containing protein, partial [Myxococcaceae bacterium]|nr:DUF3141 domain-containing protein [Myxococcaceae bacterium]
SQLIHGKYLFRLEPRTLDHLRALGTNSAEDERRFATVAKVSEVNLGLYRAFAGKMLRAMVPEVTARALRELHPHRLRFALFSNRNPMMWPVKALAAQVRSGRRTVSEGNPLLGLETAISGWIASTLAAFGSARDAMTEAVFLNVYGNPILQALVGLGPQVAEEHHIERDLVREEDQARARSELEQRFEVGGLEEAIVRALIYVRLAEGSADERGYAMFQAIRATRPAELQRSMEELKRVLREQFLLLSLDEQRAVDAIPKLLPRSTEKRRDALEILQRMISAGGALSDEGRRRSRQMEAMFEVKPERPVSGQPAHA